MKSIIARVVEQPTASLIREANLGIDDTSITLDGLQPWTVYDATIAGESFGNRFGQGGGMGPPEVARVQTWPTGKLGFEYM